MATTLSEGFDSFSFNLEITDLQSSVVATRQQNVRAALTSEFQVLDTFLTGSYRRNTMIAPLAQADVDVFIVLDPQYYHQNTPQSLLERVRTRLRVTYPQTPRISKNGQAVTISFTDFSVDVVPGFHRQGGGYLIPDATGGRWLSTDPKRHVEIWTAANQSHEGDLIPLMKMLKCWNRAHSGFFRSFHLEALTMAVLNNVEITNFPSGIRYVFEHARAAFTRPVLDPAGYDGNLGDYVDMITGAEIANRLESAYQRAVAAETAIRSGRIDLAFERYRQIFGDTFPAYS